VLCGCINDGLMMVFLIIMVWFLVESSTIYWRLECGFEVVCD